MKRVITIKIGLFFIFSFGFFTNCFSQSDWFKKNVQIRQSMETAEQKEEPAQFQITIPKDDSASWLINVGVSIRVNTKSAKMISKFSGEYHRNTLTDEKQNNLNLGYTFVRSLGENKNTEWFTTGDLKYVYDREVEKSSAAANLLFTFVKDNSNLNWNTNTYFKKKRQTLFLSLFAGSQFQYAFKAKNDSAEGFIMRPLFNSSIKFDFNNKDVDPVLRLSANYIGRYDVVNSTKNSEGYTDLLTAGVELFMAYKPVKISLGVSYNYGSDPLKGLAKQNFWLLSLNLMK